MRQINFLTILFALLLGACSQKTPLTEQDVIFSDEFIPGQTGSWVLEEDAAGRTAVEDERLIIEINEANTLQYTALAEHSFTDFALDLEVSQLAGHPESSYGVLFRMVDQDRFYRFEITGTGLYMVERHNADGTWTRLLADWEETPAINQGLNVVNHLRVVAAGSGFALYVNEEVILQFTDTAYPAGTIGLDAGTFGAPGLQVAFDNVIVR